MNEPKKLGQQTQALPAPVAEPTYPVGEPELPEHFSMLSAQHDADHNHEAHEKLRHELKNHGFNPVEISGFYGYPEKSFMVQHQGTPNDKKTIEDLAFNQNKQESVIHSSGGQNELKMRDGSPSWTGSGHTHGKEYNDYYSVLPSGHKVRLNVAASDVKKSEDLELKKPHSYGKHDGVWVFHSMHPSHDESLIGDKYKDLDDEGFKEAIQHAKKRGVASIVLSGTPPKQLLNRIHPSLGPVEPGHVTKSEKEDSVVSDENLKKDQSTAQLVSAVDLGKKLKKLKEKVQADLQSGKLKGKKVEMSAEEFAREHNHLSDVLESPSHDDDKEEAHRQAKELEAKLKEMETKKNEPEVISGKDLLPGLSNPEEECEACERSVDKCLCYSGLPTPKIEFDGKKLSIFFKSEWSIQDRENFVEDLKRRAGRILKKRYNK
jgi:hypothetical protein